MVLAGPYGCVGRSWTTYLKKYFLASYLKLFIRTHCAVILCQLGDPTLESRRRGNGRLLPQDIAPLRLALVGAAAVEVLQDGRPPHEEARAAGVRAPEGAGGDDRGRGDESGGTLAEDVPEVRAATGRAVRRDGLEAKIGAAQEIVRLIVI